MDSKTSKKTGASGGKRKLQVNKQTLKDLEAKKSKSVKGGQMSAGPVSVRPRS